MNSRNSALRQYYRKIRNFLPCAGKLKKRILFEIQSNVNKYLENCPDADIQQIEGHFGSPQSIAAAYVDDMNTEELLQALCIRKKIITAIISCVMVILLIWGTVVSISLKHVAIRNTVYIETEIIEIEE